MYLASLGAKVHRSGGMADFVAPFSFFGGTLKVRSRSPLAPLLGLLLQRWSLNRGADDHIGVKCHAGRTNQELHRLSSVPLDLCCDNGNSFFSRMSRAIASFSRLVIAGVSKVSSCSRDVKGLRKTLARPGGERPCAVF